MPSEIENERQGIFNQLNGQARLLEKQNPALAKELNAKLREVVSWLVSKAQGGPNA
jgi:hypothetical protein